MLLGAGCGAGDLGPPIPVVRIERDLLAQPPTWQVVRSHPDSMPRAEVICPALSDRLDGADMPALVLEPPGEVHFDIGAGSIPSRLVARVGVDVSSKRQAQPLRVVFEARAGERSLARAEIALGTEADNTWLDLGGKEGIALTSPMTLALRTELHDADGNPVEAPAGLLAGLGGLRLERRLERARTKSSSTRPNVVLVVMDTLRADRLSSYGYVRPTSPRLDALAARGVLFETCYSSASWTWPATASILTGLTPLEHGVVSPAASFLLDQAETLAESLQLAGFTTAAWSGNPIVSSSRNFDQGFEHFWSARQEFQKTETFFEDVRAFLRRQAGARFFLYLHLADPHRPLRPLAEGRRLLAADVPPEFAARSDGFWSATSAGQGIREGGELALDGVVSPEDRARTGQLYDASVWSGDHWLGQLLDELAALELDDETVVAFTSDHGEELFERGILGHGQSLGGELVRVPLVLAGPGVPRAKRMTQLVSSRTVAPLLASLAGVAFQGDAKARNVLANGEPGEDWALFSTAQGVWKNKRPRRILGLTDGKWKLVWAPDGEPWGASRAPPEGDLALYRLDRDAGEREDLGPSQPEEVLRLRALLQQRIHELEAQKIGASIPAGVATLELLKRLGYVGDEDETPPDMIPPGVREDD